MYANQVAGAGAEVAGAAEIGAKDAAGVAAAVAAAVEVVAVEEADARGGGEVNAVCPAIAAEVSAAIAAAAEGLTFEAEPNQLDVVVLVSESESESWALLDKENGNHPRNESQHPPPPPRTNPYGWLDQAEVVEVHVHVDKGDSTSFFCQICQMDHEQEEGFRVSCGHVFCRGCLASYLKFKVEENELAPMCPHVDGSVRCVVKLQEGEILSLLDDKTKGRYQRFSALRTCKYLRECPSCQHESRTKPTWNNKIVCQRCGLTYCYYHSTAHNKGVRICSGFAKRDKEQNEGTLASAATISRTSRPCPGCRKPIERSRGCDHMYCTQCFTKFCYRCGNRGTHSGGCKFKDFGDVNPTFGFRAPCLHGYGCCCLGRFVYRTCPNLSELCMDVEVLICPAWGYWFTAIRTPLSMIVNILIILIEGVLLGAGIVLCATLMPILFCLLNLIWMLILFPLSRVSSCLSTRGHPDVAACVFLDQAEEVVGEVFDEVMGEKLNCFCPNFTPLSRLPINQRTCCRRLCRLVAAFCKAICLYCCVLLAYCVAFPTCVAVACLSVVLYPLAYVLLALFRSSCLRGKPFMGVPSSRSTRSILPPQWTLFNVGGHLVQNVWSTLMEKVTNICCCCCSR